MGFTLRVALYRLLGYREWTESLGEDREWVIQSRQASIYARLSVEAASRQALALPFRFDVYMVLASSVPRHNLEYLKSVIQSSSPTPVEMLVGCGTSPREALENAMADGSCESGTEAVLLAHIDLNNMRVIDEESGLYESYLAVSRLYSSLIEALSDIGGMVFYLGGDNILAVLPFERDAIPVLEDVIESLDAKAGVGFARTPREAARLATSCLDKARRTKTRLHVCTVGEAPGWLRE